MTTRNTPPTGPGYSASDPDDGPWPDRKARDAARLATIIAVIAGIIAVIALIVVLIHASNEDDAPANCDPTTDYVCEPETRTEEVTTQVPTTSLSPTEVPVPTVTESATVTTTTVP